MTGSRWVQLPYVTPICRISTAEVQWFCKPKVRSSNLLSGSSFMIPGRLMAGHRILDPRVVVRVHAGEPLKHTLRCVIAVLMKMRTDRSQIKEMLRRGVSYSKITAKTGATKGTLSYIAKSSGKPLTLRLDHFDGDGGNHDIENLRFICPNCDSQSPTYGHRNRGRYARLGVKLSSVQGSHTAF